MHMTKSDAIKHFGSSARLAKAVGVSKQAVGQWGNSIPETRQYQLQVLSNGVLTVERPQTA